MLHRIIKEEERIEKVIRGLLKLPENKRCINCNSLGPQYVCTTFSTFVCTNCSGIHREFTHRVKSVSMAKFTAEEVSGLQVGGNERARQIYFKSWDSNRNSLPDGSDLHRLRDFVKHVYVDLKFAGERSFDRPASNNVDERHSVEKPSPSIRKDDRNLGYYIDEGRSPRCRQTSPRRQPTVKTNNRRGRAAHFEIVDDRFREDSTGAKRFESLKYSSPRTDNRSSDPPRRREMPGLPDVRDVREILGDKVPRITIADSSSVKSKDEKDNSGSSHAQASPHSMKEKEKTPQRVKTANLMDFDFDGTPEASTSTQTMQLSIYEGSTSEQASSTSAPASAPNSNSLELMLFDLLVPEVTTGGDVSSNNVNAIVAESVVNAQVASGNGGSPAASHQSIVPFEVQWSSQPAQGPPPPANDSSQRSIVPFGAQWSSEHVANESSPRKNESKSGGRQELPADLFVSSYQSYITPGPAPVANWQYHQQHHVMGYGVQYHQMAPAPTKSRNPFDIGDDEIPQVQAPMFPSMAPLQGALPHIQASPYAIQQYSYGMEMSSGQQVPNGILVPRAQGDNSFGNADAFSSLNPVHQSSLRYQAPPPSRGGNPFG